MVATSGTFEKKINCTVDDSGWSCAWVDFSPDNSNPPCLVSRSGNRMIIHGCIYIGYEEFEIKEDRFIFVDALSGYVGRYTQEYQADSRRMLDTDESGLSLLIYQYVAD